MKKITHSLQDFAMITFGTAIVAAAVFLFFVPSNHTVSSNYRHSKVLEKKNSQTVYGINLLVVGFLLVGREFGSKTVYTSILLPTFIWVLERLFPNYTSIMQDPFLDMICYIFVVSIGLAILFNRNASSGGLDIVAKLLNKFFRMDLGTAMSGAGMVVALSSGLVYDAKTVVLSILGTYLNGIILDRFIFGFTIKKRVCVISEKEEEIRQYIIRNLHSGATIYQAQGAYHLEPKKEIITIVDKNEYLKLMNFLDKVDPNAFVTVYDVNKIIYRPKL